MTAPASRARIISFVLGLVLFAAGLGVKWVVRGATSGLETPVWIQIALWGVSSTCLVFARALMRGERLATEKRPTNPVIVGLALLMFAPIMLGSSLAVS